MQAVQQVDPIESRILIVDDQEDNIRLLELLLESAGLHNHAHTIDSRKAVDLALAFQPDLLLLDLQMPYLDGFAVMAGLTSVLPVGTYLPILILAEDIDPETKKKALSFGADDFVSKPFDATEVVPRVKNLLRIRHLDAELHTLHETLETRVRERTKELAGAQLEILERFANASEYRDDATGLHTHRIGRLSAMIGRGVGMSEHQAEMLRLAATLHDVGKVGVPDRVLLKEGKLTTEEFVIIKSHTNIGGEILRHSKFPLLQMAREIAISHHERWDGLGYPQGLKGRSIPLPARIVAIADVFDALTNDRPYKKAWTFEAALYEMKKLSGRQFDPDLLDVFCSMVKAQGLENLTKYLGEANSVLASHTALAMAASDRGSGSISSFEYTPR